MRALATSHRLVPLAAALVCVVWSALASADDTHYQDFVVGARAVGLGGAFTSLADDPSGLFYNPAGIVDVRSKSLQVSTSLYGFERGTLDRKLELPVPGVEDLDVQFTDLIVIPTSAGFVNGFGEAGADGSRKHAYGVSIVVPTFRSYAASSGDQVTSYKHRVTDRSLWSGVGYARKLGPKLRLGVAGYYALRSVVDLEELTGSEDAVAGSQRFRTVTNDIALINGNVLVIAGVKYLPSSRLALGLSLRSPSIPIHSQATLRFARGASDPDATPTPTSTFERIVVEEGRSQTRYAPALRLGASYQVPYTATFSLDVSAHAPTSYRLVEVDDSLRARLPFNPDVERRGVVNVNAGGEYLIVREVSVSVGLFTDFSTAPSIPKIPQHDQLPEVDLVGLTMGLGYFGEHTLSRLGVVYSFGHGRDVIPENSLAKLMDDDQSFSRVSYSQSFFYIYASSTFRY